MDGLLLVGATFSGTGFFFGGSGFDVDSVFFLLGGFNMTASPLSLSGAFR